MFTNLCNALFGETGSEEDCSESSVLKLIGVLLMTLFLGSEVGVGSGFASTAFLENKLVHEKNEHVFNIATNIYER
jgi:hypothetical protein